METYGGFIMKKDYTRSYPTYEEWKHECLCIVVVLEIYRSYPTYEEWKRP